MSLHDSGAEYRVEPTAELRIHRAVDIFPTDEPDAVTSAPLQPTEPISPPHSPASIPNSEFRIPHSPHSQTVLSSEFNDTPLRYVGEVMHTYILIERGDELLVIDKHAAHERILFDKMRLNDAPLMSQELLIPETLTTDGEGAALVEAHLAELSRLGFSLESFGDRSFAVRAVPADIDAAAAVPLLEELTEKLREGRTLDASDVWERLAATVACKAAIKAGWVTEKEELILLARRVLSGEVTHCPHGRPVMTVITRKELDKRFGRIV